MDERLKAIYTDIEIMFSHFLSVCPINCEEKVKLFLAAKQDAQKKLFELANQKQNPDLTKGLEKDKRMREGWRKRKVNP